MTDLVLRRAGPEDVAALQDLQQDSITSLAARHYRPDQVEAFARLTAQAAARLVADAEVWVLAAGDRLAGCAGWQWAGALPTLGRTEALRAGVAQVRNVFVRAALARRGLAGRLLSHVEAQAYLAGARRALLDATRGSEPFYLAHGYRPRREVVFDLGGIGLPGLTMEKRLDAAPAAGRAA